MTEHRSYYAGFFAFLREKIGEDAFHALQVEFRQKWMPKNLSPEERRERRKAKRIADRKRMGEEAWRKMRSEQERRRRERRRLETGKGKSKSWAPRWRAGPARG